ncbi:hypothetical protein J7K24_00570 [bacterium]|nr:hypothetical protein [bacterium]
MSLFEKKKEISREELREKLREAPSKVPTGSSWITSSERFEEKERVGLEKEVFGKKYGSYISKEEYKKALRELEEKKIRAKTSQEKLEIERKIRYLKEFGGIKKF